MRLTDCIRENRTGIVAEWESFAESLIPASPTMTSMSLRDHIEEILDFIIEDIESAQSPSQQIDKSHGKKDAISRDTAAQNHAAIRLAGGFDIGQMLSEYRSLRASVTKLWGRINTEPTNQDVLDLIRFNESIDQEVMGSVNHYTKQYNHSKELFLGILSHDIRTPISAACMCAELVPKIGPLNEKQSMLLAQIIECTSRADEIVTNLFDISKARFGSGLPVVRHLINMDFVARQLVEEMNTVYPASVITLAVSGEMEGQWDKARIGQVFSNLIGNAVQYGFKTSPIDVQVKGTSTEIVITVHNEGVPIHSEKVAKIFRSLGQVEMTPAKHRRQKCILGLGSISSKKS